MGGCLALACSAPDDGRWAMGTIEGRVIGTKPVAGAAVQVWHVRDGERAAEPLSEATTDPDGRFHLEVGVEDGVFLIESFGGSTRELSTGETVELDAQVRLAVVLTDFQLDEKLTGLMVTPVTTMAEALGEARLARGDKETDYAAAHQKAAELLGAHFGGIEPTLTQVADPTTETSGTLDEPVRYGLVLAGLSELAREIAVASEVTANVVNSVVLTGALAADLASAEALFDGEGPGGPVAIGQCPEPATCTDETCATVCDIGARTAREHLANALEAFVNSSANVTGLALADIAEMKLRIAKNDEPELFGEAPTDTEGAPLTIDETGFWVDAGTEIWWTRKTGQQILGTVEVAEGDAVTITVEVNGDVSVPGQLIGGGLWAAAVPAGAFDASPATNTLRAIARDGVGNLTTVEHEVRVDGEAASVELLETTIIDESADVITSWSPVTHDHPGASVTLGGAGCPTVKKHVSLMGAADNPLRFRFRATDGGAGLDPAASAYQVREKGGDVLLGWTTPSSASPVTSGEQYEIILTRADIPALAETAGGSSWWSAAPTGSAARSSASPAGRITRWARRCALPAPWAASSAPSAWTRTTWRPG